MVAAEHRVMDTDRRTVMELEDILNDVAYQVVDSGTWTESRALWAMAAATRDVCPGAAAALVDWGGSEIARLRAFGIVHGVVLRVLGPRGRLRLLEQLRGTADLALAG
jgi:hypothetical protein